MSAGALCGCLFSGRGKSPLELSPFAGALAPPPAVPPSRPGCFAAGSSMEWLWHYWRTTGIRFLMGGKPAKLREVYTDQRVSGVPFRGFSKKVPLATINAMVFVNRVPRMACLLRSSTPGTRSVRFQLLQHAQLISLQCLRSLFYLPLLQKKKGKNPLIGLKTMTAHSLERILTKPGAAEFSRINTYEKGTEGGGLATISQIRTRAPALFLCYHPAAPAAFLSRAAAAMRVHVLSTTPAGRPHRI